ncbi:peptidoglycan D,D-transpeptidase FtsI family protein [Calothrix sp. NIES-3974]|uniref:peptidoglycan D,D-transpeptidase FtsI family protein n=1 Tax=Calothrix sp. NIES-3974 TaxID=2005462 RepID=UPI000B60FC27|nr:penicillin-binding protein 2 [Calothrix sp. NIES-3974]BAZ04353.1 penicillin-binding protein [Calothrix sp. NIES-3974]
MKQKYRSRRNWQVPSRVKERLGQQPESHLRGKTGASSQSNNPVIKSRLFMAWGVLIVSGLGLILNLYRLQIVDGATLAQRARNQQMLTLRPYMPRRSIIDRNGNFLAIDQPVYTLYAHPNLFKKSFAEVATALAPILNQEVSDLEQKFQRQKSGIILHQRLSEEDRNRIVQLRLDGLDLRQKYARFYPQDELVAETLGFVNANRKGQAGIEQTQERLLERKLKTLRLNRTRQGVLMPDYAPEGFIDFDDFKLQLTIDSRLQRVARNALKEQIQRYRAKRGAVIVMDAYDGGLLAMVNHPTFNPNEFSKADMSLLKNWTVTDLYEPGSTFKPLNVAIALENGVIQPHDTFVDNGSYQVYDRWIKNAGNKRYGRINIAQILEHSSNIGMVQIIQKMRPHAYYGWLERLGLGQAVQTDLFGSISSRLKPQDEFASTPIEPATASFGQGFSLTPLQLVQMIGALANGGKLVSPHTVKGLVDSEGKIHDAPSFAAPRQIFSPMTTQRVVEMMETVVAGGTGKNARIPGYRIAGKTGTAEKASQSGGYSSARITSFVSILPAQQPRYVVLAIVDEPKGKDAYGGTVAAPISKKVMEALITIEKIPPSLKQ